MNAFLLSASVYPAWLPLVDLFRNYYAEIKFSLSELRQLFEVFRLSSAANITVNVGKSPK